MLEEKLNRERLCVRQKVCQNVSSIQRFYYLYTAINVKCGTVADKRSVNKFMNDE